MLILADVRMNGEGHCEYQLSAEQQVKEAVEEEKER